MMQTLAKKQEEKYTGMVREGPNAINNKMHRKVNENVGFSNMIDEQEVSLEINGFYNEMDRIEDDFNIFEK